MELTFEDLFVVGLTTAICATLVLGTFRLVDIFLPTSDAGPGGTSLSFLIQDGDLIDATPEGYALLSYANVVRPESGAVLDVLRPTFPDIDQVLAADRFPSTVIDANDNSGKYLRIQPRGEAINLTVQGPHSHDLLYLHQLRTANNNTELSTLRTAVEQNKQLMWEIDISGQLVWANAAYLEVADRGSQDSDSAGMSTLPTVRPFAEFENTLYENSETRMAIPASNPGEEDWFDIVQTPTLNGRLFYANDVNNIVRSEISQQHFLKTISQTFAQLSIGLAIFDRRRRLSTFNPALIDLTSLPVDFLSSRPSLDLMLDRLRETRMLPEPKDYARWRDGFSRLETEARNGTYSENWNLPDGQTYRVTGRPHPDGAFALLFEDISAEISLTRRFRSEIETGQAVLDRISDAVAVFSGSGNLVMSNQPYEDLWDSDVSNSLIQSDLRSEINSWKSRCAPTRIWQSLRGFVQQTGPRDPWSETVMLDDGRPITCQAEPVTGGMTMVRFSFDKGTGRALQEVTDNTAPSGTLQSVKG